MAAPAAKPDNATDPTMDDATKRAVRAAMIGLYYDSMGSEFEIRGAPSVLLPPDIQPIRQEAAIELLLDHPQELRAACWLLARSVKPFGAKQNYPRALSLVRPDWDRLGEKRREYRQSANLLSDALVASRDGQARSFDQLVSLLSDEERGLTGPQPRRCFRRSSKDSAAGWTERYPAGDLFTGTTKDVIGASSFGRILGNMNLNRQEWQATGSPKLPVERIRGQVEKLETDVGLGIEDIVKQFADAAAFAEFYPPAVGDVGPAVLPVTSMVRQNVKSLVTVATVTTFVTGDFEDLVGSTNPVNWRNESEVFTKSEYVNNPFDCVKVEPSQIGDSRGLLAEEVGFSWGSNSGQHGNFHNVLNVHHKVSGLKESKNETTKRSATVEYSLCRSIDSRILWDFRLGGIEVDSGFVKVRNLYGNTWRVTYKKYLQFSDRTPYSYSPDWGDLGQMLNYYAPAALSWWLESETYNIGRYAGQ